MRVNRGELPVFKGHVLSAMDLTIRKHILEIMCQGGTALDMPVAQAAPILERLASLVVDGLVEVDGMHIQVTPTGFSFLRNVCMAFDERLHEKQYTQPLFSSAV